MLSTPIFCFCTDLIYRIRNKNHMYDATEIFRTLSGHKTESFVKLGFYLLSFFYYLYRCVGRLLLHLHHITDPDGLLQHDCGSHIRERVGERLHELACSISSTTILDDFYEILRHGNFSYLPSRAPSMISPGYGLCPVLVSCSSTGVSMEVLI